MRGVLVLALGGLLLLTSCGDRTCGVEEPASEFVLCWADSLEVPDTVSVGESIPARVWGVAGPDLCYQLERIECELVGPTWVLRPIARHYLNVFCWYMVSHFDEVVSLTPRAPGWVYIEVLSRKRLLLDSVYVRPPQ